MVVAEAYGANLPSVPPWLNKGDNAWQMTASTRVYTKIKSTIFHCGTSSMGLRLEDFIFDWDSNIVTIPPLRPSTSLNFQAATRFIEHSLPDLTAGEQRQSMRDISKRKAVKNRHIENRSSEKKRKYQSSEKQSVRVAAQEFLEKATRELLGDNKGGLCLL